MTDLYPLSALKAAVLLGPFSKQDIPFEFSRLQPNLSMCWSSGLDDV